MIFIFLIPLLCGLNVVTSSSCFWNSGCPYKYFASKTLYGMIRGDIRDSVKKTPDCEPISIWIHMRHGKRNPSLNFRNEMKDTLHIVDDIVASYESGNSSLCAQDVENLREWVLDQSVFDNISYLSEEGYQEMVGVGRRLKEAFPKFLAQLDKGDYTFRSLRELRIQLSLEGFVKGLGNENLSIDPAVQGFHFLTAFVFCKKYINGVIKSNAFLAEVRRYQRSSEYLEAKHNIGNRLGLNYSLSDENFMALWNFCRSNSSGISHTFSPWCALLTTEDNEVMEYIEDLKHYYRNGYGVYNMSRVFGEILLSDLLMTFRNATTSGKKISTYVTDSTLMDMMVTTLGIFKDKEPITGSKRVPNRQWRTSTISTFTSNFMAVLNRCGKPEDNNLNVAFYYNEEPLTSMCNNGVCSWKEFEDMFSPFLNASLDFC